LERGICSGKCNQDPLLTINIMNRQYIRERSEYHNIINYHRQKKHNRLPSLSQVLSMA
jgi:hypothetical protein